MSSKVYTDASIPPTHREKSATTVDAEEVMRGKIRTIASLQEITFEIYIKVTDFLVADSLLSDKATTSLPNVPHRPPT